MKSARLPTLALAAGIIGGAAAAQMPMASDSAGDMAGHDHMHHHQGHSNHHAKMHGPIGVMGRHILPKGKFMLAYRAGYMSMAGNRIGSTDVSPTFIATTVPNRFATVPGQPPTLRVVPTDMTGNMHMFGAMYGVSDRLSVSAMAPYIRKSMTSLTFAGPAGTAVLGSSKMTSKGLGDVRIGAYFRAVQNGRSSLLLGLGLSAPTGSITETGPMLMPTGARMIGRMAYGMQLGSGTYDLYPSLTWQGGKGKLNWGGQVYGVVRLGTNDQGYSLGDGLTATAWISKRAAKWVSLSSRVEVKSLGEIDGIDPNIVMPNPGADPLNYGGETVALFAGADFSPQRGALRGHKLGLELGVPVYQNLNGVQLKRDWSLAFAWRKSF